MPIGEHPFTFDPTNDVHARALSRLESEQIAWIGTTGRDGYPHAVPIWFLWTGGRALVFSEPQRAMTRLMEGRTVIVIAHRLSTAERDDVIGVVADGRLAELGSHDDLVARGGFYAGLFATWSGGIGGSELLPSP